MKKSLKTAGIVVLAAGALSYPAIKLYQYIMKRRADGAKEEGAEKDHTKKGFARAYRGKNKPHHRHAENGHQQNEA